MLGMLGMLGVLGVLGVLEIGEMLKIPRVAGGGIRTVPVASLDNGGPFRVY